MTFSADRAVLLIEGRGDGTFEPPQALNGVPRLEGTPQLVDLNQDGRIDILAPRTGFLGGRPVFLQNLGAGAFAPPRELGLDSVRDLAVVDLDGDGDLDLFQTLGAATIVLLNDGAEQFFHTGFSASFVSFDRVHALDSLWLC